MDNLKFFNKGISTPVGIIIIVLCALIAGGVLAWQYFGASEKVEAPEGEAFKEKTADWKTYRNEEYGFEIKYPLKITFSSSGPNFVQQALNKGEQISGTVQPSYDTIIFSNTYNVGFIQIFHKYEQEIREENYKDKGVLYTYGPCDIRWGFNPEIFSLDYVNNVKILMVRGTTEENISLSCYYLKNLDENLIVLSNREYQLETFNQMLSTFRFIETGGTAKLTIEELKNTEYYILSYKETVQLKDGYYFKQWPDSASGLTVDIYEDKITFGDLNNDGKEDAAVALSVTGGGSGVFRELAVVKNEDGNPVFLDSDVLGDRIIINSVIIKSGTIIIDMITHGPADAMCCPTLEKILKYKLSEDQLIKVD